jgi:DNA-binding NarL/FixJ family response regulator
LDAAVRKKGAEQNDVALGTAGCRRFVGRHEQRELLRGWLRTAYDGRGSLVLISGEAGIGKSRLLAEAAADFAEWGGHIAYGRCHQYVRSAFAPISELLNDLNSMAPGVLQSAPLARNAIAPLLGESRRSAVHIAGDDERRRIFDGAVDAFRAFAARAPLLLALEDLHWADDGTTSLLEHCAAAARTTRIAFACTCRAEELHRRHPLRSRLAKMQSSTAHGIVLAPLGDDEIRTLIAYAAQDGAVPAPELIASICRLAEGNPFFAEELLKSAAEAPGASQSLPISVAQSVLARTYALHDSDRYVLNCAAVLEHGITPEVLARIVQSDEREICQALERAAAIQLIVKEEGGFSFRHALTREALRNELLGAERRAIHAKIAHALESVPSTRDRIAMLAHHYYEAGNPADAARYGVLAGDAAAELGSYEDARRSYERALECTEDASARAELSVKLAQTLYYSGDGDRARRKYEDAVRLYEQTGDGERAARASVGYARLCYNLGDSRFAFELLSQASNSNAVAADSPVRYTALTTLGGLHSMLGEFDRAFATLDRAEALDVRRDRCDERFFHEYRSVAYANVGRIAESVADCAASVSIGRELGDALSVNRVLGNFGALMGDIGERELSLEALEKALAGFRMYGARGTVYATFLIQYAQPHYDFGELRKARWAVEDAFTMPVQTLKYRAQLASIAIPVGIALQELDLVERCANPDLLDFVLSTQGVGSTRLCTAFVQLFAMRGEREKAIALAARCLDALASSPPTPMSDPWIFVEAAALGDESLTVRVHDDCARVTSKSARHDCTAHVQLVDALIAKQHGRSEESIALATAAAEGFGRSSRAWRQARALEVAGRLNEAKELYRTMGDARDFDRVAHSLSPLNRRGRSKSTLTPREREVARLLVEGKANKTIAEVLLIGERTVETHVASILNKIGAHSRAQAAALIARGDPFSS